MQIGVGTVLSVISAIVAVSSLVMSFKKNNKTDGFELGKFMGEMKSEICSIKEGIEELKKDNKEVDEKIAKGIHEHELRYTDKILNMIAEHEMRMHK